MTRHYVFVSGIGGWMLKKVPGKIVLDNKANESNNISDSFHLIPPHVEIQFNRFITHDDGILIDTYMQVEGASYDEANAIIKHEVNNIITQLHKNKEYQLGSLGILRLDNDHHIFFEPSQSTRVDNDFWGFEEIAISPIRQKIENSKEQHLIVDNKSSEDTIIIPLRKSWLQKIAVVAIILICFFINTGHQTNNNGENYASVIDHDILIGKRKPNIDISHPWETNVDDSNIKEPIQQSEQKTNGNLLPVVHSLQPTFNKSQWIETKDNGIKTTTSHNINNSPNGRIYYIIVASCSSQREADHKLKKLSQQGYDHIGILQRDGRYRLYINVFGLKSEAEHYLFGLREVSAFHDAWLLPIRLDSLSRNSKNQNNEQLSMELSHLTTRTDRDQGGFSS